MFLQGLFKKIGVGDTSVVCPIGASCTSQRLGVPKPLPKGEDSPNPLLSIYQYRGQGVKTPTESDSLERANAKHFPSPFFFKKPL